MKEELPTNQAMKLVQDAERILLVGPKTLSGDSAGSLLACALSLEQLGKEVTLLSSSELPGELNFLPRNELFTKKLGGARDFLIEIDVSKSKVDTLSYNVEGDKLLVNVSPSRGSIEARDLKTKLGPHKYDLIIILDSQAVNRIDAIYEKENELFHSVPVLNIDHRESNERYGTVNLVDTAASSTSEVAAFLLKELGASFDHTTASALLTGIISATHVLKSPATKPSTLKLAAELIESGASKEEIVENLYKTKPLSAIKLWGRVLARLEAARGGEYVYSSVSYDDFKDCGATPKQSRGLMDELVAVSRAKLFILFFEFEKGQISVRLRSPLSERAGKIAERFGGEASAFNAKFQILDTTLTKAITKVISTVEGGRAKPGKQELTEPEKPEKAVNVFADEEDEDYDEEFYPNIPPPQYLRPKEGILTWRPDDEE